MIVGSISTAVAFGFADPSGVGLKCILIEMEREVVEGLAGEVVIGQDLVGIDRVLRGVVLGVDLVVDDALGHGRGRVDRQSSVRDRNRAARHTRSLRSLGRSCGLWSGSYGFPRHESSHTKDNYGQESDLPASRHDNLISSACGSKSYLKRRDAVTLVR